MHTKALAQLHGKSAKLEFMCNYSFWCENITLYIDYTMFSLGYTYMHYAVYRIIRYFLEGSHT